MAVPPPTGVMIVTLSVQVRDALAGLQARYPDRHIWQSPSHRWFAALKRPPAGDELHQPITISADSLEQLAEWLASPPKMEA